MAIDVITDTEFITCPHCNKRIALVINTNVYGIGEYGKPSISVDEKVSKQEPLKIAFLGRVPRDKIKETESR